VQLVRAGEGRWSEKIEAKYLAHLRATGCKRRAAAAVGFSKTAIHNRQINYPDFNARCDDAIAQATSDLHSMVVGAGIATFDPSPEDDDIEVPKVTIAEAIAILKLKGTGSGAGSGSGGGGKAGRYAPPEPSIEEVRASILRKLDAIEAHERREAGECPEDWDEE
jgi:hypothetical protein